MYKFTETFDEVFSYDNLFEAYKKCLNGVHWKGTVQKYESMSLSNLSKTMQELQEERFQSGKFYKFDVMERGKLRHIKSVNIEERVVQRCLCEYCLSPALSHTFIYDNSACIKGKGVHFAMNRFEEHLKKSKREYYILQFDFSKYFDTIPHDLLLYKVSKVIKDEKIMRLLTQLVNDFEGDKGLGLGSQISQICALYYPSEIDHYFSCKQDIIAYGRYMDDGYMIAKDKETLRECLKTLENMSCELGLKLNEKKTQIKKLTRPIVFLKARFFLTQSGKIVRKPNKKNISRNRSKLKKMAKQVEDGMLSLEDFNLVKQTILGNLKHFDAYHLRQEMNSINPISKAGVQYVRGCTQ